ncbi:MAG: MBL fold metallo-hydrolase [Candidatus Paceibacterota bacterium]|jgi:metallo-beta-lactamase family protein
MEKKLKLTFCGGAGSVTGANFLLEVEGKKILVDCGLSQGTKLADDENWEPFQYDPTSIDILFVTHAHVDHVGRIPKLIHDGFHGKIYSTIPTKALAEPMLDDTVFILSKYHEQSVHDFFTKEIVHQIIGLWEGFPYHDTIKITEGLTARLLDAGHILGSAMIEFTYNGKKIVFTGDLGNSPSPLLRDTEKLEGVDYLIMESVYGDRNHEDRHERRKKLEEVIEDNYKNKGTLIVPTFSLERSQELLFEIDGLVENKKIPTMPIFFDSPLAIRLTKIYKEFEDYFNDTAKDIIHSGDDIFTFPGLRSTLRTEESKMIIDAPNPKIIIAGSGMSNGGRIVHHEHNYLPNPNNTILLTGYQSLGTMGRLIQEGAKSIKIKGEYVDVKAKIVTIGGYSGHKDSDGLLNFAQDVAESVKKIFVVMGEPKSSLYFAQKVKDYLALEAYVPIKGEVVVLDCE